MWQHRQSEGKMGVSLTVYIMATRRYNILRHNGVDIGKKDFLGG
jgi:hypothetical protein